MPTSKPEGATRIAFLGLGAMGLPMASNLVEGGFHVAGYDVVSERSATLASAGGHAASTPAAAAAGAQVVAAIPFDAAQERDALLGPGGALETLPPGGLVILMATIGPAALRELASEVTARGHRVVDAPVTGGVTGAIAGTLTVIAAGAAADLEAAAAEAMALARAAGADLQQVYDLLITGQARSQMFVSRVGAMLDGGFNTGSSLRIFTEKDMPLVLNAGRELGVPMVTASAALQTMQLAAAFGLEDASDARLVQLLADPLGVAAEQAAARGRQSQQ